MSVQYQSELDIRLVRINIKIDEFSHTYLGGSPSCLVMAKVDFPHFRMCFPTAKEIWKISVLTRPKQVQAVFKDSNLHLKGENFNQGWLCGQILGKCLGILNLDNWTRVRAVCVDIFQHNKSSSHIPFIRERTEKQFEMLQSTKPINNKQMTIQPSEDLKILTFQIFCDIIYRDLTEMMEVELRELLKLRESIWLEVTKGGFCRFSISQYLPTSTNRKLQKFKRNWENFNDRANQRAINLGLGNETPIVLLYSALEEGRMFKTEVLHTLDELLFENLDVSLGALAWNVIFLAGHPETQEELRNEIAQVKNEETSDSWVAYVLGTSNLIQACILESARLKPIVLFTTVQAIPSPRVVDGFIMPAGTHFLVDTHELNVSDPYWGKDSTLYRPKRFLETRNPTSERYRYFRFGFGPRNCLGKYVIDVVLKIATAHIVENFQVSLVTGENLALDGSESQKNKFLDLPTHKIILKERP
ncbi:cytochrome P450 [Halenospora varia]|nr:cytochrome P450 [Halenospora varia]